MGKHDEQYYSKIFDAVELVHNENVVIMQVLLKSCGVEKEEIDHLTELCNEKFKDIRKW